MLANTLMSQILGENTRCFASQIGVALFLRVARRHFSASEKRWLSRNRHTANHRANKRADVMEVLGIPKIIFNTYVIYVLLIL